MTRYFCPCCAHELDTAEQRYPAKLKLAPVVMLTCRNTDCAACNATASAAHILDADWREAWRFPTLFDLYTGQPLPQAVMA